jgi:hypothetical protein
MILTAIVGIVVDIRATSARLDKSEEVLKAEIQRFERALSAEIDAWIARIQGF